MHLKILYNSIVNTTQDLQMNVFKTIYSEAENESKDCSGRNDANEGELRGEEDERGGGKVAGGKCAFVANAQEPNIFNETLVSLKRL